MNIYAQVKGDTAAWCSENEFVPRAEFAASSDGTLPERYLLYTVISDPDTAFAANRARARRYRVQFDIVVPRAAEDRAQLPALFDALEAALIAAGYRPQGNYRMADDAEAGKSYIQKDYMLNVRSDARWGS